MRRERAPSGLWAVAYLTVRRVLRLVALVARSRGAKQIELLALHHEVACWTLTGEAGHQGASAMDERETLAPRQVIQGLRPSRYHEGGARRGSLSTVGMLSRDEKGTRGHLLGWNPRAIFTTPIALGST